MPSTDAQEVHIETLYAKIKELSDKCDDHHKLGLAATQEVHRRIDDFTKIMMQMSEINKDVQSLILHQKAIDLEVKEMGRQLIAMQRQVDDHAGTVKSVHRIAWGVAAFVAVAICTALFKVIGL